MARATKRSCNSHDTARTGQSSAEMQQAILNHLHYTQAKPLPFATRNDWYMAVAHTVRDQIVKNWLTSFYDLISLSKEKLKVVSYMSSEFLLGPHLGNNLVNMDLEAPVRAALETLGQNPEDILKQEVEPGLGNGGLGRLAACYLESLATLRVPAVGYGIRYEFGIFDQEIRNGWQVEKADNWLKFGNPWEVRRPDLAFEVKFGGHTEFDRDSAGRLSVRWIPDKVIMGVAYDTPVAGYRSGGVSVLRLWKSEAVASFDFQAFNAGDYNRAVDEKVLSETITKVLYPNDEPEVGKLLRLCQQYFFVSCSLQDMIFFHLSYGRDIKDLSETFAIQINDTHPAIGIAELMRLLVDEHTLEWDEAWGITTTCFAYTNHTLLSEALEKWPLPLFSSVLPRIIEIIYEINRRFLDEVQIRFPDDHGRIARLSLIDETGDKYVRMANLACVGSHAINGVAALHTELLKKTVLYDFHELFPEKFHNVTNGVTPRRWVALSNPGLTELISSKLGDGWLSNLETELSGLQSLATSPAFQRKWLEVKQANKEALARIIRERTGIDVDPASLFDVQVKRIHEYKRQHLNVLHIITLYNRIKHDPRAKITPRTFIFGGKAAPGYYMAKLIIKLINSVAEVVNNDTDVAGRLKVVFFPDFNVTNGQLIYPAADLSEQISVAGKEASGTGNMKLSLNGALTIGTLDGANIEIREEVGEENFFLFGLNAAEAADIKSCGYQPRSWYEENPHLREAIDQIAEGVYSNGDRDLFRPLVDNLLNHDAYLVLADYQSYIECQDRVSAAYQNRKKWAEMSILNVARMGKFSSDRAIREYCEKIWKAQPV
ncbi:glycogen/starch/alpha-glucan phosphorylase [Geobacter sp.]|uniref:glycogen/starch/alpha-glucan phosphorylase n=1 Tax=Geobacter sp. TaxID=46610 RepID=UPI0027BA40F0|nr:glycogen/starch/alpha-glucan phosphorylase [Geobacter sp.]